MFGLILPYRKVLPTIASEVFVAHTATVIGDVEIGEKSSLWYGVVVRGDVHEIRIGARTNIQDGTIVHVTGGAFGTYIGSGVLIAHGAVIHGCTLEDGCFIGMAATVMDGAVVESGAMVAAGALVTPGKRVETGQVWGGSPARYMRHMSGEETALIPKLVVHYIDLAAEYMNDLGEP